jgi:hypothetical protein
MRALLPVVFLSTVNLACGSRGGDYDAPLQSEGPYAASSFVVALNNTDCALIAVDPQSTAAPQGFAMPANARHLTLTPDGNSALVVSGDAQSPGLAIVSLVPKTLGQLKVIALPANPDVVNLSPDGHFALLTYDATATQTAAGQAIIDPNEAVVVDLTTDAATSVALGTDSPAPSGVSFAVPGQGGTQLTAVLFSNGLAVLDLGNPSKVLRVPVQIQGGPAVAPLKALFSGFSQGQGYVYVLAAQSDDVIAVSLSTLGQLSGSINFLAGGSGLVDIALPPGPPPPSTVLALYSTTPEALQLDATGLVDETITATLAAPATNIVPVGSGLLLLWSSSDGSGGQQVSLWDPAQGEVATVQLDGPVQQLVVGPSGTVAVATVSAASQELVVLQLGLGIQGPTLTASPLLLASSAVSPTFDTNTGDVYFGEANQPFLARVTPSTLQSEQVTLDAPAIGVGLTSGAAFASQTSSFGQVTTVPISTFTRTSAEVFPDFLLTQEVEIVSGS